VGVISRRDKGEIVEELVSLDDMSQLSYAPQEQSYQYYYVDQQQPYQQYQYQQFYTFFDDVAPTGISYLDQLLSGGFRKGDVYLVAGEAGLGKTIFSVQFLKYGAEVLGETGLYITIDEPADEVKKGVKRALGWDLDRLESSGRLIMIDMRTQFKVFANARDERIIADPRDIARTIIEYVKKYNVSRIVIDPIAPLIITSHHDIIWVREYLRELVFQLRKLSNVVTLMTSEIPTGENKISRFGVEEYLAGGVIKLELREICGNVVRVMFIRKMRWTPVRPIKLLYDIYYGYGIYIYDLYDRFVKQNSNCLAQ